jgi:hypothetical protein
MARQQLLLIVSLLSLFGGVITTSVHAAPATNAAPAAVAPPPDLPADDITRYGKILKPADHLPYPFKLSMPFPGFGEVKVPTQDELDMRMKLEQLATLSDAQIRAQLAKWPAFATMSLSDEGTMLTRIEQFREYRTKLALMKAQQLGLLTLNTNQQARFEKEYWAQQLQADRDLAKQLEPIVKARQQKLDEKLFRDFSSPQALAQTPKAPGVPPAAAPPAKATASDTMMMH